MKVLMGVYAIMQKRPTITMTTALLPAEVAESVANGLFATETDNPFEAPENHGKLLAKLKRPRRGNHEE